MERLPIRPARQTAAMPKAETARVIADKGGVWLSLLERFVRDEEVVGSNPARPTNRPCAY